MLRLFQHPGPLPFSCSGHAVTGFTFIEVRQTHRRAALALPSTSEPPDGKQGMVTNQAKRRSTEISNRGSSHGLTWEELVSAGGRLL